MTAVPFTPKGREVEVLAKARRRQFTAEYKKRILEEADAAAEFGAVGALLRREGLYWSNLTAWRLAREHGELAGLTARKRGPKAKERDPRDRRIAELEREIARVTRRAQTAEALIELQKKVSELLGIPLPPQSAEGL